MKLKSKRIVITGGTSGVGYHLVKQLQLDNQVIVLARDQDKLEQLWKEFPEIVTLKVDLSQANQVNNVVKQLASQFSSIDVLINNAAIQNTATFLSNDFECQSIDDEINVNFRSICHLTYHLLPMLNNSLEGTILNINSALGLVPKTSSAVYCATKGALNIFSQSLQYQLENTPVSVLQAFLPLVDTAMTNERKGNKLDAATASSKIIYGLKHKQQINDIGKVRLLRILLYIFPWLARKILRNY